MIDLQLIKSKLKPLIRNTLHIFDSDCIVLIYHRVNAYKFDPELLSVFPERFDQQMGSLCRRKTLLSLSQMCAHLRNKTLPANSAVVTFDDGYADNFQVALPILLKHKIPATIFASTGMIEEQQGYWWDIVSGILTDKIILIINLSMFRANIPLISLLQIKLKDWRFTKRFIPR